MGILKDTSTLLQEIPVFAEMEPTQLKLIAYVASNTRFRAGDTVSVAGETAEAVFIIEDGVLDRRGVALARGTMLGQISILSSTPERHDITARTDAAIVSIPRGKFEELLEKFPDLHRAMLRDFAQRLAQIDV